MFQVGDKVNYGFSSEIYTVILITPTSTYQGPALVDLVRDSDGTIMPNIPAMVLTKVSVAPSHGFVGAAGAVGATPVPKPNGITSGAVLAMQETTEIKIGDTVEYYGSNAKVLSAHYDFGNGEMRYKIELLEGDKTQYNTSANYLKVVASSADKVSTGANGCECGCWAVPGFENNHSYWCPKYRKAN